MTMRFIAAMCCAAFAMPANAGELSLSTGVDFSSGDYGDTRDTDILFVPVSARYRTGDVSFQLVIPYISVDGPGDVVPGDGGPILTDNCARIQFTRPQLFERFCSAEEAPIDDNTSSSASGLGDIVLGASYTLPAAMTGDFGITFEGRVKLPTADKDDALGTGETDGSVAIDAAWYGAAITPFARLGYRFLGDPTFTDELADFTVDLQNGFTGSAGFSVPIGRQSVTFAYDYLEASVASVEDIHELSASLYTPLGDALALTAYGVAGLTDSSPDFALGLSLRYTFGR